MAPMELGAMQGGTSGVATGKGSRGNQVICYLCK